MNDQNKAELRRLAEAATQGEWNRRRVFGQLNVQDENFMLGDDDAKFIASANPTALLSLLDENAQLIDEVSIYRNYYKAERDQLRAEVEALRGLLVQCALSAATLRADAPHYANHAGFNEQFTDAIRKASGVKIGHGVASPEYPSQADAIAAMVKEGSAND